MIDLINSTSLFSEIPFYYYRPPYFHKISNLKLIVMILFDLLILINYNTDDKCIILIYQYVTQDLYVDVLIFSVFLAISF